MIIINAISATEGGALTVVVNFISSIDENAVCFCAVDPQMLPKKDNVDYCYVGPQRGVQRIAWDIFKLNRRLKGMGVNPRACYSFNNMAPFLPSFKCLKNVVYYHQAIPLSNIKPPLFSSGFFSTLFYRYFYLFFVRFYDNFSVKYVVQSEWVKVSLGRKCSIPSSRITVEKPVVNTSVFNKSKIDWFNLVGWVYPASDHQYKNHLVLIDAVEYLSVRFGHNYFDLCIGLTLEENSWVYGEVVRRGLNKYFCFIGLQKHSDILGCFYHGCGLVFPSLVETVGLPLLEARQFGVDIVASDLPFSREFLSDYQRCDFLKPDTPEDWAYTLIKNRQET